MEQFGFSPENKIQENSAEVFRTRLSAILNTAISVENINDYAKNVLDDLVSLTEDVVSHYQQAISFESTQTGDALENAAYTEYGLPNLGNILDMASEKLDQIASINRYITLESSAHPDVITPPDQRVIDLQGGEKKFEKTELLPRLTTLLYLLETDFNIPKENIRLVRGSVSSAMVRHEPYYRIDIPELNRLVYLCDEQGNATYVFDQAKLKASGVALDQLDIDTKENRNAIISEFPGIGARLIQTKYWRANIAELLSEDIPSSPMNAAEQHDESREQIPQVSTGELDPYRGFWEDPEGKHWGSRYKIVQVLGIGEEIVYRSISNAALSTVRVADLAARPLDAYSLEEVLTLDPVIEHLEGLPQLSEEGEGAGFYEDPQGLHWSSIGFLAAKTGVGRSYVKKEIARLRGQNVWDRTKKKVIAYCYEDLIKSPEIKILQELPHVTKQGEWQGFWIDEEDRHWSSVDTLIDRMKVSGTKLNSIIVSEKLQTKKIINRRGQLTGSYCLEEIEQTPEMRKYLKLPLITLQGDGEELFSDEQTTKRVGSAIQLAKFFGISDDKMRLFLTDQPGIEARQKTGGPSTMVYPYDLLINNGEFQEWLRRRKESKITESSGEWKNFYIDEQQRHWASIKQIAEKVHSHFRAISRIINQRRLAPLEIKVKQNVRDGYCLEEIEPYLKQRKNIP